MAFKQWEVGVRIVMKNIISHVIESFLQSKVTKVYVIFDLRVYYKKINRLLGESTGISTFN